MFVLVEICFRNGVVACNCYAHKQLLCSHSGSHLDKLVAPGSYTARFIDRSICSGSGICHLF